jgi:hypothetical protein
MFGLELQTSGNVFTKGVLDREVAYVHNDKLMTLEGDETTSGAMSELEFVTKPCAKLNEATEAVAYSAALAKELAQLVKQNGPVLRFNAHDKLLNGTWVKDCELRVNDPSFVANPQGTVGIKLAMLRPFIERVLGDLVANESTMFLKDLADMRDMVEFNFDDKTRPELIGFLTACQIFLVWASWDFPPGVAIDAKGFPLTKKDPNSWRVFTFPDSPYLREFKLPNSQTKAFEQDGVCRVLVNRDSPKSMFKLLHRTDFCSMYHALPADQREFLQTLYVSEQNVPIVVWPYPDQRLFKFPYRADPPEPFAEKTGEIKEYQAEGWPDDGISRNEKWWLTEHGPLVSQWWASVVNGRPTPDNVNTMLKDLASPPPGMRGRDPGKIARFPGADENKREYYGMGAFPMDPSSDPPLAVFEHRAFPAHPGVGKLEPLTFDKWPGILAIFYQRFVEPFV